MRSIGNCGNGDVGEVHEARRVVNHVKPLTSVRINGAVSSHRKNCACQDCRVTRRLNQSIEARRASEERMGRSA